MFRRHKRELELNDFDDDGDQQHDATDIHRYIAAAYNESMSKLSEYTPTQAGRIAAAYRPVAEAESMGFLPPPGKKKKKKKKADATQGTAAPTPPLPADAATSSRDPSLVVQPAPSELDTQVTVSGIMVTGDSDESTPRERIEIDHLFYDGNVSAWIDRETQLQIGDPAAYYRELFNVALQYHPYHEDLPNTVNFMVRVSLLRQVLIKSYMACPVDARPPMIQDWALQYYRFLPKN